MDDYIRKYESAPKSSNLRKCHNPDGFSGYNNLPECYYNRQAQKSSKN